MEKPTSERLYMRPRALDNGETFAFEQVLIAAFPASVRTALAKKHTDLMDYYIRRALPIDEEKWTRTLRTSDGRLSSYAASVVVPQQDVRMELTYFYDVYKESLAGEGRVLKGLNGPIAGTERPMVVWVKTFPGMEHQNLGERRLAVMQSYAKEFYGSSVQSDYEMHDAGYALWNKLMEAGRAKEIEGLEDEFGRPRFEFIK